MRRVRVGVIALVWLTVAAIWFWFRHTSGLGSAEAAQALIEAASGSWWAVVGFLTLSVLRPFALLPATLLTMGAGLLFGPVFGVAVAAAGANASAMVGHTVGDAFVGQVEADGRITRWRHRLSANSFEAVLLMRLVFLPYDLVNYAAGYLRVRRGPFLAATAIGSLPGTVSFVLLGASLTSVADGTAGLDVTTFVSSVALIALSLVVARLLRHRRAGRVTADL